MGAQRTRGVACTCFPFVVPVPGGPHAIFVTGIKSLFGRCSNLYILGLLGGWAPLGGSEGLEYT